MDEHTPTDVEEDRAPPRLDQACLLARKGRYDEASSVLADALAAKECSEADALDLQARIFAQQGLLLGAERCWLKAQALVPERSAYAASLAALRSATRGTRQVPAFALGAVLVALLVALAFGGAKIFGHLRQQQVALADLSTLRQTVQDLSALTRETQASTLVRLDQLQARLGPERDPARAEAPNQADRLRLEEEQRARAARMEKVAQDLMPLTRTLDDVVRRLDRQEEGLARVVAAQMEVIRATRSADKKPGAESATDPK